MPARIYLNSMSKLNGLLRNQTVFTRYKLWNPRGSRTLTTEMRKFELEKHKIQKGFGLVVVNKEFCVSSKFENLASADTDKKNIEEFCKSANIETVGNTSLPTHDLKADEMKHLFNTISKKDFSCYDAFICFISSHGTSEGIDGIDGKPISENEILEPFKNCASLEGKPKLFFIQSCGGEKEDTGVRQSKVVADHAHSIFPPFEADVLVAVSSVDGYRSYRSKESGSVFITELTKVFNKHAHNMNLTDMLTIVSKTISEENFQLPYDKSVQYKQVPCFSSTLRKAIYFDVPEPNHLGCIAERVNSAIQWIVNALKSLKFL